MWIKTKRIFGIIHHRYSEAKRETVVHRLTIRIGKHTGKQTLRQVDCGSTCNLIIYRYYHKVKADVKVVYSTVELIKILQQS